MLYLPFMESFFRLVPLALEDLLIALAAGSLVFVVVKLDKLLFKR